MVEQNKLTANEPQKASDYDDRTTLAVKSVLIEIGQVLGAYKGKFAIVGGSVPWLLIEKSDMDHVGTTDLDIAVDPEALGDGEYALLIDALRVHGYGRSEGRKKFQLSRMVPAKDGGADIEVVIDFLMPRDTEIMKNDPPILADFAIQKADGADLALRFKEFVAVKGDMPNGANNKVEIAVCSIPALIAMKGHALNGRYKRKDAYDIYYCVRGFAGGIDALAAACLPILGTKSGSQGFGFINDKFSEVSAHGPVCVREFVMESHLQGDRGADEWQQDAFGQVDALMRAMMLRE